jgi:TatD DNase family protein
MLIDSHCHLDHFLYKKDLKEIITRAKKEGIKFIITNGIDYETNIHSIKIAEEYPEIVRPALGFYPPDALDREYHEENKKGAENSISKKTLRDNLELIKQNKDSLIAIGEIGLDMYNGKNLEQQKTDLRKLIKLAIKLKKPIILHTRKAEKETLDILNEFKINPDKVILHCFSGKSSIADEAIKKGYIFSIPTNITRSESFQHLAKVCPINQILTETDGPYLSPFKNDDKSFNRNEPSYIPETIKKIAEIKKIQKEEVEKRIFNNFKRIFEVN